MGKEDLTSLFSLLDVQSKNEAHYEVSATSLKLLESGCTRAIDVLKQCLVALIKQDKYEQCSLVLKSYAHIDSGDRELLMEKLYIYYKLNDRRAFQEIYLKIEPGLEESAKQKTLTRYQRGLLHVVAQFHYKIGKYSNAVRIYQLLAAIETENNDNEVELACNERAALCYSSDINTVAVTSIFEDSYDLLINQSLVESAKGNLEQALSLVQKANRLAESDGFVEDQASAILQQSFLLQLLGRERESKQLLEKITSMAGAADVTSLLAVNNLLSLKDLSKYSSNFTLLLRELNVQGLTSSSDKFTVEQWDTLQQNIYQLKFFANSTLKSKSSTFSHTLSKYQELIGNVALDPYKHQARKLFKHTMSVMKCGISGRVIGLLLLAIQLQVKDKQWDRAILLAEFFLKASSDKLDVEQQISIYLLIQLYQRANRSQNKHRLLESLLVRFKETSSRSDTEFWKFVGFNLLAEGKFAEGKAVFEELLRSNPSDDLINRVLGQGDVFEGIHDQQLDSLISDVDIDELVALGSIPFKAEGARAAPIILAKPPKKRRVYKKKKFSKNYPENTQPDPERWIPMKERSYFRLKKKQLAKQTQGGGSGNKKLEQSLDISKAKSKSIKK
ncbi:LAMI_0G10132g1_1 [Lachancea mirantina]|uniref:Signal recognition particle subunit SRP72 n=1 Tax=Lachancea mirantina TaxID=1230905 RepID=A0A1G4KAJ5_9SACH|nr:LAMI_0G10132g1_1 [Lachancea mirantina]